MLNPLDPNRENMKEIKFERKSNRLWISTCGHYRIAATGIIPGLTYSASYSPVPGEYDQLGLFMRDDAATNAANAKQACYDHAANFEAESCKLA